MHFWHLERCTFPSHVDFFTTLICCELWTINYWRDVIEHCYWCTLLLPICFEGQIELILLLNVFLCCHTWQLESNNLVTSWYPIYCNPRTDGVQAAFGCSMEALRTPGESTGTAAIARKCSRRDTYTIRTGIRVVHKMSHGHCHTYPSKSIQMGYTCKHL